MSRRSLRFLPGWRYTVLAAAEDDSGFSPEHLEALAELVAKALGDHRYTLHTYAGELVVAIGPPDAEATERALCEFLARTVRARPDPAADAACWATPN